LKFAYIRAVAFVLTFAEGVALAQDPPSVDAQSISEEAALEAKKRYASGQKSVAQRQFVEAALHFEAAHSYAPSGVSLISAAIAWESANQPQRAADAYARALDEPGLRKPQLAHARSRLDALERSLATLAVTGDEGARVQLDDNVDVPVPARLHGNPGVHRLAVWSSGKIIGQREIFLRLAHLESVAVPWREAPPPRPTPPPPPPPAPRVHAEVDMMKVVGGGLLGAGLATAVGGVLLQLSADRSRAGSDRASSAEAAESMRASADVTQSYGYVSWIAASAFVAGGVALLLWPRGAEKPAATVSPTATGALIRAEF